MEEKVNKLGNQNRGVFNLVMITMVASMVIIFAIAIIWIITVTVFIRMIPITRSGYPSLTSQELPGIRKSCIPDCGRTNQSAIPRDRELCKIK